MSERQTEKREMEWGDHIPREEDDQPEPYEKTYRDGIAMNECWAAAREYPGRQWPESSMPDRRASI